MTCYVLSGTLNPTHSLTHSVSDIEKARKHRQHWHDVLVPVLALRRSRVWRDAGVVTDLITDSRMSSSGLSSSASMSPLPLTVTLSFFLLAALSLFFLSTPTQTTQQQLHSFTAISSQSTAKQLQHRCIATSAILTEPNTHTLYCLCFTLSVITIMPFCLPLELWHFLSYLLHFS